MQRLTVASRYGDYDIVARPGAVKDLREVLLGEDIDLPRTVVTNTTVAPLWAAPAARSIGAPVIELADGERHKRWPTVEHLLGRWLEDGLHRGDAAAAIGGGVLTDTVGFAAAVYLRGISWIAVPTTLLAMVDASVGGKTGVNLEQGKNLVGAFWPPRLVVIDVATLATLPERELRAGMAEVVKTAWIGDHDLLAAVPDRVRGFDDLRPDQWQDDRHALSGGQGADRRRGRTRGRKAGGAQPRPHPRPRPRGGDRLPSFSPRRGGGLGAVGGGTARSSPRSALGRRARRPSLRRSRLSVRCRLSTTSIRTLSALISGTTRSGVADGIAWVLPSDKGVELDQRVPEDEALEVFRELQKATIWRD